MEFINLDLEDPVNHVVRNATFAFRDAVQERLRGCDVRITADRAVRVVGEPHIDIWLKVVGWGESLARQYSSVTATFLEDMDIEDFVAFWLDMNLLRLSEQVERSRMAQLEGIARPLRGLELGRTSHLSMDKTALQILTNRKGSIEDVRRWVHAQMPAAVLDRYGVNITGKAFPTKSKRPDLFIRLEDRSIKVAFDLNTMEMIDPSKASNAFWTLKRSNGKHHAMWMDDKIFLYGSLPEIAISAFANRYVGEVIPDTPIGHRKILRAKTTGSPYGQDFTLIMKHDRQKLHDPVPDRTCLPLAA